MAFEQAPCVQRIPLNASFDHGTCASSIVRKETGAGSLRAC